MLQTLTTPRIGPRRKPFQLSTASPQQTLEHAREYQLRCPSRTAMFHHSAMEKLHLVQRILRCPAQTAMFHHSATTESHLLETKQTICDQYGAQHARKPASHCHHQLSWLFGGPSETIDLPCTTRGEAPEPPYHGFVIATTVSTPVQNSDILELQLSLNCTMKEATCQQLQIYQLEMPHRANQSHVQFPRQTRSLHPATLSHVQLPGQNSRGRPHARPSSQDCTATSTKASAQQPSTISTGPVPAS